MSEPTRHRTSPSGTGTRPSETGTRRGFLANSPLGIPAYRQLYTGAVTTSMAYTMQSAMAGWLMASLSGSALLVGLVQAASTLPFLLFGLVSGSVSDLFDRRYVLVITHLMMGLATASVGVMAQQHVLQPWSLVACTLLCGLGYTFYQPAQQASINGLVPRPLLPKAVALGSVAFNAARSVGPALAGLIAALLGEGLAVMVASLFFLPMLPAAMRAVPPREVTSQVVRETLWAGILSGMRFAAHARVLRAALIINFGFCFCAAALWAMFPLVAQQRLGLAADGYGFLYSTFGLGAVASALWLPRFLRQGSGASRIIRAALVLWSAASLTVGLSRWVPQAVAQSIAPAWVRARAVANNQISVQAGLALGSLFWGAMVNWTDLQFVLIGSAVVMAVFAVLTIRQPVRLGVDEDVTPDGFLAAPAVHLQAEAVTGGGIRVRVQYAVAAAQEAAFSQAMQALRESRRRNGALRWRLARQAGEGTVMGPAGEGARVGTVAGTGGDTKTAVAPAAPASAGAARWEESFELASALEWQRFPERMMQADRMAWEAVQATLARS